jgi:hypothetical protein
VVAELTAGDADTFASFDCATHRIEGGATVSNALTARVTLKAWMFMVASI